MRAIMNEIEPVRVDSALQGWLSPDAIVAQVTHVQKIMRAVMRRDEHYGTIPGTKKDCLLKSGAEKLCFTFRLFPEFEVTEKPLLGDHREIIVKCILRDPSGKLVGQGVGSCSTMESRYRYRNESTVEDAGPIPAKYWDAPKDGPERNEILVDKYGPGKYRTKKIDNAWVVQRVTGDGGRVENPDIPDQWNTVLKMAKKRAHVDATITATATSDIFTQDMDDLIQHGPKGGMDASQDVTPSEADALRAEIYRAGDALDKEVQERIEAAIQKAGDDLGKLKAIIVHTNKTAAEKGSQP
jgi:hypothetical protein